MCHMSVAHVQFACYECVVKIQKKKAPFPLKLTFSSLRILQYLWFPTTLTQLGKAYCAAGLRCIL